MSYSTNKSNTKENTVQYFSEVMVSVYHLIGDGIGDVITLNNKK
ncbi:hypothetical protein HDC33_000615 [Sporosarcina sp. JAI121]|nr:hypothetical protein [Sporosarcina sp. JAI121]